MAVGHLIFTPDFSLAQFRRRSAPDHIALKLCQRTEGVKHPLASGRGPIDALGDQDEADTRRRGKHGRHFQNRLLTRETVALLLPIGWVEKHLRNSDDEASPRSSANTSFPMFPEYHPFGASV